jgi:excisionase family DNA binding protein
VAREMWYSIQEAAQFLGISTVTLRRYIKDHKISAYRIAGRYRFKKEALEEFLEACRLGGPQKAPTKSKDNPGHGGQRNALADEILKDAPNQTRALYIKAFTASRLGKYEEAEKYYRKILKNNPRESAAYLFLGLMFQDMGDQDEALQMWREVVNIDKSSDLSEVARYHITRALRT